MGIDISLPCGTTRGVSCNQRQNLKPIKLINIKRIQSRFQILLPNLRGKIAERQNQNELSFNIIHVSSSPIDPYAVWVPHLTSVSPFTFVLLCRCISIVCSLNIHPLTPSSLSLWCLNWLMIPNWFILDSFR